MSKIKLIAPISAPELEQARRDESIVTGQPFVERPYYFENIDTGQLYYDLYGCVGWPTEISENDKGLPGYCAVMGVVRGSCNPQDAVFQLLAEGESKDVGSILSSIVTMRDTYGFNLNATVLRTWYGDPDRYNTNIALFNEATFTENPHKALVFSPPDDFYELAKFDNYVRSLRSVIIPGKVRLYFGKNEIIKNHLREFYRDDPAVMAIGGLVHSLLNQCMWMDQMRETAFRIDEG